jgi:hypothetical protein
MTVNVLLSGKPRLEGYGNSHARGDDGAHRLSLGDGSTVREVIRGMGVPVDKIAMIMLNFADSLAKPPCSSGQSCTIQGCFIVL